MLGAFDTRMKNCVSHNLDELISLCVTASTNSKVCREINREVCPLDFQSRRIDRPLWNCADNASGGITKIRPDFDQVN